MQNTIKKALDLLFDPLPFSKENEQCRETLSSLAEQKYNQDLNEGLSPAHAAGNLLIHSDTVENISSYLGAEAPAHSSAITPATAPVTDAILEETTFRKIQKSLRRNNCALSLLLALSFNCILTLLLNLSLLFFCIASIELAIFGALAFLTAKRMKRTISRYDFFASAFVPTCRSIAKEKCDLYTKKLTNILFGSFSLAFILIFSVSLGISSFQYSLTEVVNIINYYLSFILLSVYLTLKNYFCRKTYANFFHKKYTEEYMHELRRISLFSSTYYLLSLVALLLLRNKTEHIFSIAIAVVALYFVLAVFYNFTRRHRFTDRNIVLNIRKALCYTLIAACLGIYNFMKLDLYLTQPYINTISSVREHTNDILYNEDTGVYTIVAKEDNFKILQLTDIHLGGSILSMPQDTKALKACYRLIRETSPDLVIVTGDLVFPMGIMSFSLNNHAPIMQFANFMRNVGIPWAFTYGNHDTEALATLGRAEVDELMKSLSYKTSKNLLYPYVQPDIYGRSNQMIEVRDSDGGLMQALFLIDSNDYIEAGGINEYDYIHDDQVEWYRRTVRSLSEQEGGIIPSMIFTHIPLREYKEANDLYESNSDEVTHYYGILGEKMIDRICCSEYDSKLFDTAVELKSTRAIFCGHDHYNNQSLEYKGIRLTYGYSIDYLAMPGIEDDTEQRGATLITVKKDGTFDITPHRLIDLN